MRGHLAALRGARRMPRRADLDPQAFADTLPYVNLIDVVAGETMPCASASAWSAPRRAPPRSSTMPAATSTRWSTRPRARACSNDLTRTVATGLPQYGRYGMPFPGRGFIDIRARVLSAVRRRPHGETASSPCTAIRSWPIVAAAGWHLTAWHAQ
jgi:hypothetical protein